MDFTKVLGALLHQRAERSPVNRKVLHEAMRRQRERQAGAARTRGDVFHGPAGAILQEGVRRNGRAVPGWPQGTPEPFPGAPGYPGHAGYRWDPPCTDYQDRAKLLLQAMIQATKADGRVDAAEEQAITGQLGHLSPQEIQFLRQEFARQIDVHGLAQATPHGMEDDVYAASLMAIHLDSVYEGRYLSQLAECLRLPQPVVDRIHDQMGERRLR